MAKVTSKLRAESVNVYHRSVKNFSSF